MVTFNISLKLMYLLVMWQLLFTVLVLFHLHLTISDTNSERILVWRAKILDQASQLVAVMWHITFTHYMQWFPCILIAKVFG